MLIRLIEEGGGSLRQQRLSDDLQWERSRLSRHLGRMQARGLVTRTGTSVERQITATADGRRLARQARAAHANTVRRHLTNSIPEGAGEQFWDVIRQLASVGST